MFVRILKQKRGNRIYRHVQIAESFRDPEKGNAPRTRIIAHLGTVEGLGEAQIDKLIVGLRRAKGEDVSGEAGFPFFVSARDFGHVYAVAGAWDRLGLSGALKRAGVDGEAAFSAVEMIRLMVVNRLCEPGSKLALLEWLESVHYEMEEVPSYHHLLRAMDRLIEAKEKAEPALAKKLLRNGEPLDLVFYDITSTYFEGDRSLVDDDFRKYGYSRDGRFDKRQVVIGMVMTPEGIPLCHHVFPGNTVDKTTVVEVVGDLKTRFNLKRVVFVGDRGMLSDANLEELLGADLGFIVAHPLRRNEHARQVIGALWHKFDRESEVEQFLEEQREELRFVVAYSPKIAKANRAGRKERLKKADTWIEDQLTKLLSPQTRGRKPTLQGMYDRIRDYLRDRNLLGLYDVTISGDRIEVVKNRARLLWESKIDGMLMVETTDTKLPPEEVIIRYKELAEIERGWRSLKSTLLLRPVYHWTENRIRAHIFLCVIALQVERWMRNSLKGVSSVPKAIDALRQIKAGEIKIGETSTMTVSKQDAHQKKLLAALGLPPPPSTL